MLISLGSAGQAQSAPDRTSKARAYYTRCPDFHYQGRHKLFRHALSCAAAKRKARYVLEHRAHPPGWRCSLDDLPQGYGACARGKRAFEFLPSGRVRR
jgi:hypothetical protein